MDIAIRSAGAAWALAAVALAFVGVFGPAPARAGTYNVYACGDGVNESWSGWRNNTGLYTTTECWAGGRGIYTGHNVGNFKIEQNASAHTRFDAPAGTDIRRACANVGKWHSNGWTVGLSNGISLIWGHWYWEGGSRNWNAINTCWDFAATQTLYGEVTCRTSGGCPAEAENASLSIRDMNVLVNDYTAPSISAVGNTSGWVRASASLGFNASDNVGPTSASITFDGVVRDSWSQTCNSHRTMCDTTSVSRGPTIDTSAMTEGCSHSWTVAVTDRGGITANQSGTLCVDDTPPATVTPTVDPPAGGTSGEAWRTTNSFNVRWANPASTSPIVRADYEIRGPLPETDVITGTRTGTGVNSITGLTVPEPGEYTVKVKLTDQAGNAASGFGGAAMLRFDNVPPGRAHAQEANGWLNAQEAQAHDQHIELQPGAFRPVSGIKGYSITTDGSQPDTTVEAIGEQVAYRINNLPQGETTIRARAVSGAGVGSTQVDATVVRVDKTPPDVDASGAPDAARWSREPATIVLSGTDQAGLSGMAAAPGDRPLEEGAYLVYRVDGGAPQRARGGEASTTVGDDGQHVLTYQAYDLAGNASSERTVRLKIDRSPPDVLAFEAQDADDPRRISVAAADRTSGIAGGQVELRRAGSDAWQPLPTELGGSGLVARVDGTYQFRARAVDAAGNERTTDRRSDGQPMELAIPLRLETRVTSAAAAVVHGRSTRRCRVRRVRRNGRVRRVRRCPRQTPQVPQTASELRLPFDRRALATGKVTTAAGQPIANAEIRVLEQLDRDGAELRQVGGLRSDQAGEFRYEIPAGASRLLRFAFDGSDVHGRAHSDLRLHVAAGAQLRVSRRSVRLGRTVLFRGRLLGAPIPPGGRTVSLEVYYRRRWQSFATPRTDAIGRFRFRRRFTAEPALYKFRVRVPRERAYPYELGFSNLTRVRILPR
jgi:hypothetical protein